MKTKTWKKAVLFSLVTSWSVFTTGCISPAIFKAILGLVEAIFNDTTGTKPAPAGGTATNTNLGQNNAGNNGIQRDGRGGATAADGTRTTAPGTGTTPAATTPGTPVVPTKTTDPLAQDDVTQAATQATDTATDAATGLTSDTRARIGSARQRLANVKEAATQANAFLSGLKGTCEKFLKTQLNIVQQLGQVLGEVSALEQRLRALEGSSSDAAAQAGETSKIHAQIDSLDQGLVGSRAAGDLSAEASTAEVFKELFAEMGRTGSRGIASEMTLVDDCAKAWKLSQDCPP